MRSAISPCLLSSNLWRSVWRAVAVGSASHFEPVFVPKRLLKCMMLKCREASMGREKQDPPRSASEHPPTSKASEIIQSAPAKSSD